MRAIRTLVRELKLAYFRRALREIDPLHDDVPHIVHSINRLEAERRAAA